VNKPLRFVASPWFVLPAMVVAIGGSFALWFFGYLTP